MASDQVELMAAGDPQGAASSGGGVAPEGAEFAAEYSKDYWDLVFEQLGKRTLFKLSMAFLTLLYGIAVFAPVIANDKPYVIESVDLNGYGRALRLLRTTASGAAQLSALSDADYANTRGKVDSAPPTRVAAAEVELEAARDRLAVLQLALSDEDRAKIEPYRTAFESGIEALKSGDDALAGERLDEAKDLGKDLRKSLEALDPAKPDGGGVALVGRKAFPLAQSMAPWEAALMTLWILVASWPVWNWIVNRLFLRGNRDRIRAARKFKLLGCLAIVAASSVVWFARFGNVAEFDAVDYKAELTSGNRVLVQDGKTIADLIADPETATGSVSWAPINFGFAELHEPEKYRPPTWTAKAEIDPETGERVFYKAMKAESEAAPIAARPVEIRVGEPELNSPMRRPLGTDESGRDVLSRMIWGGRVSLSVGILSAALLTIIGVVIGSIAGFFGGWVDVGIMRTIEVLQSIPAFFLILLALAFTDPETLNPMFAIVIVIAIVRWTGVARLVRGEFLRLREQEFVVAARALGFSSARTIFRHVLPNAMSPVLVAAAFSVAAGILTESAVSFLGFGIQEPQASWGSIVNESRSADHWWIQLFPGLAIFMTVTCYNLVGDAIRDAMDPKMKV
ncbi:Oligopeptide transport system permease protein OppC [Planctomycetes bacterium Poly30]|uniref:Oligopeptide transport system permease protein OppC n=1 Tax=Saltatorellus ferox TaxID=2528018 RepID=A0A518EVZ3_9BACT|nr:Oligopeptide transport system permease protein OppC [Planctomycetes bacterium Poly30]